VLPHLLQRNSQAPDFPLSLSAIRCKSDYFFSENSPENPMTPTIVAPASKETPLLFEALTWREFKAVEQLLDRPGYRLSFLDGVLEIRRMPGEPHETVKKRMLLNSTMISLNSERSIKVPRNRFIARSSNAKKRISALLELYLLTAGFDYVSSIPS
jgi:hypothetical protein